MMFRPVVFFFAVVAFASSLVCAAPVAEIATRQIGDIQCNINRLSFVGDIAGLQITLKTLSAQTADDRDPTASAGIQSVTNNISAVQSALGTIAEAILTGQAVPAEARVQVESNLAAAQSTLAEITSADPAVTANLQNAKTQMQNVDLVGSGILVNCK
ncbi:hypothetical protein GSI_02815 [Ganoderma sinense ZZ0214-1]|uniref:Cell wall galactomannoprotein n=1 Tax=Ganoderma sinense ZZ0214-1 TaxID=1077348 RepID=A0A2G8SN74_9APHY|nr:hypothetical protein GSI_02815 [Ganoderma sinense ZZ0214-1]